jgi:hypothetical protein
MHSGQAHEAGSRGEWLRGDFPRAVGKLIDARHEADRVKNPSEHRPIELGASDAALDVGDGSRSNVMQTDFICRLAQGELTAPAILRVFHLAAHH